MVHSEYVLDDEQMSAVQVDVEVTPETIQRVRKYLADDCKEVDDATIRRFYVATGGDLDATLKRLETTIRWSQTTQPAKVVCTACAQDPRAHYAHVCAFDKLQRPVIYSCLEMASNKEFDDNQQHMLNTFETTLKVMPPGIEQWCWICDFHGFGMTDVSPKLAKAFLAISAEHYPERLGLFVIVDAPKLFAALWKAVKKFVDKKTYRKIRFVDYDPEPKKGPSELCTQLDEMFDAESAAWFLREMASNRAKKANKTKVYDAGAIHRAAVSGTLLQPQGDHDSRGTPALLRVFAANPDILQPQAGATVVGLAK